ncbi:MAG TPA: isocitrate/isopropylmalate dehydrogenase family protein [Polyangiaceae bacterium LLY-WYZ-14_1]|nr:isocitrate/isopropylmalate dehydrogenase family protein [Polyangiaceae bacterium LLY-WYZ-14_1]
MSPFRRHPPDHPGDRPARIAVIPGDGVGQEVIPVGCALLEALGERRGRRIELVPFDLGAERYLADGTTFPESDRRTIRETCDAVLLGALGDPRVPELTYAKEILFGLRFGLDLYCNLRPIRCLDEGLMPLRGVRAADCDLVVLRENTEGSYVGLGGVFKPGTPDEVAIGEDVNTRKGVERIVRAAFELARSEGRRRVHVADKSNAMPQAHGIWKRVFFEVAAAYPEIEARHIYVDALCFELVRDPRSFEVIVTTNLFGDIVTDLGAALQGGMGMAASANLHPGRVSMFEPVHGSAPDLAGQDRANPMATALTVGMLMSYLGFPEDEALVQEVVKDALAAGHTTPDLGGDRGTRAVGEALVAGIHARGG